MQRPRKLLIRLDGPRRAGRPDGHGDFHPLNLIWNHGDVTGIVDWNRIAVRAFGEEVTRSATLLFSRDDGQIDLDRVEEFVAGYQQVIPLEPCDLADAVHRRWWKLLCDYRYLHLHLHYAQDDHSFYHLAEPAAQLLEWWTSHQQEVMTAFTARLQHRSPC